MLIIMKKIILLLVFVSSQVNVIAQTFSTNETPVGMEHNILFNAPDRYNVTITGSDLNLTTIFDGSFLPSYTTTGISETAPTVILITGLPTKHTQLGAWVGWSTRYWEAKRFKIEGYNTYGGANVWNTIADYSTVDYTGRNFYKKIEIGGTYTQ